MCTWLYRQIQYFYSKSNARNIIIILALYVCSQLATGMFYPWQYVNTNYDFVVFSRAQNYSQLLHKVTLQLLDLENQSALIIRTTAIDLPIGVLITHVATGSTAT